MHPCVFCGHNVFGHNNYVLNRNSPPDAPVPCPECPDGLCYKHRPAKKPELEDDPAFLLAWACYRFPDADSTADRDTIRLEALLEMRAIARQFRAVSAL